MPALSKSGSPTRTRTWDLRINSPTLYQLSYRGILEARMIKKAPVQVKSAVYSPIHALSAVSCPRGLTKQYTPH